MCTSSGQPHLFRPDSSDFAHAISILQPVPLCPMRVLLVGVADKDN